MQGFQVTFFTHVQRRQGRKALYQWLMRVLAEQGVKGATLVMAAESFGRSGRFHSNYFVELADEPVEVTAAMTEDQANRLFALLEQEQADVFYIKMPVEYGSVGAGRSTGRPVPEVPVP
jgi:PII-like signaling protein